MESGTFTPFSDAADTGCSQPARYQRDSFQALTKFLAVHELSCPILQIVLHVFWDDLEMKSVCKVQVLQVNLKTFSFF